MKVNIFWFRRDLRLNDNMGLYEALNAGLPVVPVFIFDTDILRHLSPEDARVTFIHDALEQLRAGISQAGSCLEVYYGKPADVYLRLLGLYEIESVYCNRDYDPYSVARDKEIAALLDGSGVGFHSFKDHVIFEKDEVVKDNGQPYTVFTPYSKKWYDKLADGSTHLKHYASENHLSSLAAAAEKKSMVSLEEMGFVRSALEMPLPMADPEVLREYGEKRDFPGVRGTSRLGVHLRFGTISLRALVRESQAVSRTFVNELVWRDFYAMILAWFPHVVTGAFKREYDNIMWRNDEKEFAAWCEGRTGYPMVDAGMRELTATGYMHNRVRMVTASFLVKHLLIDWRWGEAWFAAKLLDYDLASNNGGWQWAAGCGTDAAPYFRIFNPTTQMEKFDPDKVYIKKWIPEYGTSAYPQPIVDHGFARERCLKVFAAALKPG